jgi:hypothetical protein
MSSGVVTEYAPRRGWLILHISGGIAAILTGPVQLWLGLYDRNMTWHRRMGIAYIVAVGAGALDGYYMAFKTDFGWLFGASLVGLATAWVTTTAMAFLDHPSADDGARATGAKDPARPGVVRSPHVVGKLTRRRRPPQWSPTG